MEGGNRRCQFSKAERRNKDYNMDKGEFAHSVKRSPKVEENSKKITFLCVFRNAQDVEV